MLEKYTSIDKNLEIKSEEKNRKSNEILWKDLVTVLFLILYF